MANNHTKMIRVTSRGYVTTNRGRIITPIMSPYREHINQIWNMITVDRANVEEKLPDGTFVKLTVDNFDTNNFVSKEIRKVEEKKDESPAKPVGEVTLGAPTKEEATVDETPADTTEDIDESADETTVDETPVDTTEVIDEAPADETTVDETPVETTEDIDESVEEYKTPDGNVRKRNRNRNKNKNNNFNNHQGDKPEEVI